MGLATLQLDSKANQRVMAADTPAKINLYLDVLDRRADGYHEIDSVAIGVSIGDRITCTWPNQRGLTLRCGDPALLENNLVTKAALALARRLDKAANFGLNLQKYIPVGAGLGGGSSDAAATLRLCNELWGSPCSERELEELGAGLGSDVPLFFHLPVARMLGSGERVSSLTMRWKGYVLLVFPGVHVSTADVYKAWRKEDAMGIDTFKLAELQNARTAEGLQGFLRNQLEPAVLRICPRIKEAQDRLFSLGMPVRVTGSGSAMFRLFDDPKEAHCAGELIHDRIPNLQTEVVEGPVDTFSPFEIKNKES